MTSVAELRRASSSLVEVAAHVRRSAERHGTQRVAAERALSGVKQASDSPDARRISARGEVFIRQLSGTDDALGDVEGNLRTLAELAGDLSSRLSTLQQQRDELQRAIWRAQTSGFSPQTFIEAQAEIDRLRDRLQAVDGRIDTLRSQWEHACISAAAVVGRGEQALASARRGLVSRELGRNAIVGTGAALSLHGGGRAATQLGRTTVRGYRAWDSRANVRRLEGRLTTAADFYDERRLPRRTRREMMRKHNRPIQNKLPGARSTQARNLSALKRNEPLTKAGKVLEASGRYKNVLRGTGVLGAGLTAASTVEAWRAGDTERVATGLVTLAGSAMMASGALAPAGAVLVAGAMIYENREAIARGAKKAKDWVGDKVSSGLKKLNPFS